MPCLTSSDGSMTLCRPNPAGSKVRVLWCPKCKLRRRVVQRFFEDYAYFAAFATCDGQRLKWGRLHKCGYEWRWGE